MAILSFGDLRNKARLEVGRSRYTSVASEARQLLEKQFRDFSVLKSYDIFLSHSIQDSEIIFGLKTFLENLDLSVYVDWIDDPGLDRNKVSKKTAEKLRIRMKSCKGLFYATSNSAKASRWMPWELGYFDGYKGKVAIVPLQEEHEGYKGTEDVDLYQRAEKGSQDDNVIWIWEENKPTILENWLNS